MTGKQLKNAILQLAISGKLVPQDPSDEPASELLKRIRKEKEALVKQGKLKKKDLVTEPISDEEIPIDIPKGWEWVRIYELALVARGGSPRPIKEYITELSDGINWIKIGDTEKGGKYILKCAERIKPSGVVHSRKVYPGDFLLTNSMSFGRPYITMVEGCIHDGWLVISQYVETYNQDFLYYLLSSQFAFNQFSDKTSGAVVQNLNKDKVSESVFPLPPLSEQHRIVAKIEELMPLVEQFDAAQTELEKLNESLPDALKKSILQQAICGKLVPQDSSDEPASELLKRIRKEKESLVKQGKLKKKDLVSEPIADDEISFDIPESWEWCRFKDIVSSSVGKTPARGEQAYWCDGLYPWVSISDMTNYGHIKQTKEKISEKAKQFMKQISPKGSLIMSFKLTVGRTSILDIDAYHNEAITTIKPYLDEDFHIRNYLFVFLPLITQRGNKIDAIKGQTLNSDSIASLLIPLPPIAEQHRIVAKIEELFKTIDSTL